MIPEEPFNFKHFGTLGSSDAHDPRLQRLLLLDTIAFAQTSRRLLLVCPVCKHPWYKAGEQQFPRLTPDQLAFLGADLQVDTQAQYLLPRALCTICSALHLGGIFTAVVYSHHNGYRFLWENATSRRTQFLAMVYRADAGLTLDAVAQLTPDEIAEATGELRSILTWLETCSFYDTACVQALSNVDCKHLAQCCPLQNTMDGCLFWRGYAFETACPPLGGDVLVLLAVTTHADALPPFASLQTGWQLVARTMRAML